MLYISSFVHTMHIIHMYKIVYKNLLATYIEAVGVVSFVTAQKTRE